MLERNGSGTKLDLISRDLSDWRITFVDTGVESTIAERLLRVAPYVDDDVFLATYGDGLTDAPLPEMIDAFRTSQKTAMFLSVRPELNQHLVKTDASGTVVAVEEMRSSDVRINGGFFVLGRDVLDASSRATSSWWRRSPG